MLETPPAQTINGQIRGKWEPGNEALGLQASCAGYRLSNGVMQMTTGTKLGASLAVALAVIAALGVGAYLSTEQLLETNNWVIHTHQVIEKLDSVSSMLQDAETGERGFLLTGEAEYLAPYAAARSVIGSEIEALGRLISDNPAQVKSLDRVRALAEGRLAVLQEVIDLRKQSGLDAAGQAIRSGNGKRVMDDIRSMVAEMQDRERRLLDARESASKASASRTIVAVTVGTPLSLLVLAVFAMVITAKAGAVGARRTRPGAKLARWGRAIPRYAFAVVAVAVGTVLRMWLVRAFGPLPTFVTLYPAVLLVASIAGGGPGVFASILAALAADYFYIEPAWQFTVGAPNDVLALIIFTGTNLLLCVLMDRLRKSQWVEALSTAQEEDLDLLDRGTVLALDPDHRIVRWSEGCRRLYGYEAGEAVGRFTHDLFKVPVDQSLKEARIALLEHGHWQGERIRHAKDGTERTIAVLWALRRDEKGQPQAIMELSADITDRKRAETALRESEMRFATTLASIGDAVIATDLECKINFMNPEAEKLTGWPLHDALGRSIRQVFHIVNESTRNEVECPVLKALREGVIVGLANHTLLIRKDGTEAPIDDSAAPIKNTEGGITGVVLVFRDVTERKQAEEALQESEERLQFALMVSHTGAWDLDLDNHGAFRTVEHDRIFGYEELLPQWTYEMFLAHVLDEDRPEVDRKFQKAMQEQGNWDFECRIVRPDGERRWIWACGQHRRKMRGGSHRMAGIVQDITERKQVEEALRRAHDELEERVEDRTVELRRVNRDLTQRIEENAQTLEALRRNRQRLAEAQRIAHLGNWDWNIATGELAWCDEMFRIFGFAPQACPVSYERFLEWVHPDDRDYVQQCVGRALEDVEEYNLQYRIVRPNAELRAVKAQGEVTFDEMGAPARMFGTVLDVTEQVRAQEEASIRQQQLIQADKLVSLGILVAGVAHEINNPNHSIMSNVTALSEVWESVQPILDRFYGDFGDFVLGGYEYSECRDKLPGMFSNAIANSRRIEVIVNELRDFARNNPTETMAPVDANATVNSAVILLSNLVKKHTDRFHVELAPGLPAVIGNFQRIEQVVINLIQNACQSLPNRERSVTVATYHDEPAERVVIEVRDEGVGISEENMKQMGTPFFTTKRGAEGMGLGLWISSNIAHEHGGTLTFSSREGGGTSAILSLPAYRRSDTSISVKPVVERAK